jgi:XTP/dITP diphosphohydrolase
MNRLRSPGGCPWDAEQTHESLVEYLIEEAHECVEAIESGDQEAMQEELGDLLLQVVFHSRIAEPDWDIDSVISGITDKLISRHPHVFSDEMLSEDIADTSRQVEDSWHVRKAKEKGRESLTDGIPESLPALMRASKVISRTRSLDVLPTHQADRAEAIIAEIPDQEQLGDLLFELVRLARSQGWDAEGSLRSAVRRRIETIKDYEVNRKNELGN